MPNLALLAQFPGKPTLPQSTAKPAIQPVVTKPAPQAPQRINQTITNNTSSANVISNQPLATTPGRTLFTVHLHNGDVVTGTTKLKNLVVTTEYGMLGMPAERLNKINIGLYDPNTDRIQVTEYCDKMASANPVEAKTAFDNLVQMEPGAIMAIKEYLGSTRYNAANYGDLSPEIAIQTIQTNYGLDPKAPFNDVVNFDEKYSVEGTCNFNDLELETPYGFFKFGRKNIESIDITYESASNSGLNFVVQASKNISGNADSGYLNTGINIKAGKSFTITATGKAVLASLSGNTYTPDGSINGTPAPDGGTDAPVYGCLVYKIGENGVVQKAGNMIRVKAGESGKLYLAIYETVFNPANSGSYRVKVTVE